MGSKVSERPRFGGKERLLTVRGRTNEELRSIFGCIENAFGSPKIGLKNGSEMVKILVPRNGPKMVPGTELGGFMGFLGSFCDFLIFAKSYDHSKMAFFGFKTAVYRPKMLADDLS